jgi:hypothetical protein
MSEYNIPITFIDRNGVERTGYKPFFADDFANRPNSSFRLVGGNNPYHNVQLELLNQFEKTGQIIGGETGDALTYFSKGKTSAGDYLPIVRDKRGDASRNILYEVSNKFNPKKSNLYSVIQGFSDNEHYNSNQILKPNKNATFWQQANPLERKGVKITTFNTSESIHDSKTIGAGGLRYTKPLNESVYYDRVTPFSKRPLSTHMANASAETKIFLNAAKNRPLSLTGIGSEVGKLGALSAVGKVAGGLLVPVQIAMQANALTKQNVMDREYGHSDPFALRPAIDFALSGIGNNQTPAEGYRSMGTMVADPEWQMRNPISSVPYNLIHGNLEPLKAFAEGYIPESLK